MRHMKRERTLAYPLAELHTRSEGRVRGLKTSQPWQTNDVLKSRPYHCMQPTNVMGSAEGCRACSCWTLASTLRGGVGAGATAVVDDAGVVHSGGAGGSMWGANEYSTEGVEEWDQQQQQEQEQREASWQQFALQQREHVASRTLPPCASGVTEVGCGGGQVESVLRAKQRNFGRRVPSLCSLSFHRSAAADAWRCVCMCARHAKAALCGCMRWEEDGGGCEVRGR